MKGHSLLNDDSFEQGLATCTLDPALFSHEAHLRLAYLHIKKYGKEQAIKNVCAQILAYVAHLGAMDKFNKTLTFAALEIVNHFMKKSNSDNFYDFIEEFPKLKYDFKGLIEQHYKIDVFHSSKAKSEYLQPDLLPF